MDVKDSKNRCRDFGRFSQILLEEKVSRSLSSIQNITGEKISCEHTCRCCCRPIQMNMCTENRADSKASFFERTTCKLLQSGNPILGVAPVLKSTISRGHERATPQALVSLVALLAV